ncbi:hypothetical protein Q9L58_005031 [Maublancomyces gigas]|uniref:Uncharacterized protein n=1 Tax=Discina gigas TaxID=1032678 RepID=A0ABR3GJ95_9PEZI
MSAPEPCGYNESTPSIPNDDSSMPFAPGANKPLHRTSNENGTTLLVEPHVRTFHLAPVGQKTLTNDKKVSYQPRNVPVGKFLGPRHHSPLGSFLPRCAKAMGLTATDPLAVDKWAVLKEKVPKWIAPLLLGQPPGGHLSADTVKFVQDRIGDTIVLSGLTLSDQAVKEMIVYICFRSRGRRERKERERKERERKQAIECI